MYYMMEFGSLKRKEGESVSDFSKRFNKMYNRIPPEIKPSEASAMITYSSAFDPDFLPTTEREKSHYPGPHARCSRGGRIQHIGRRPT
jgi:hypothetical protein